MISDAQKISNTLKFTEAMTRAQGVSINCYFDFEVNITLRHIATFMKFSTSHNHGNFFIIFGSDPPADLRLTHIEQIEYAIRLLSGVV